MSRTLRCTAAASDLRDVDQWCSMVCVRGGLSVPTVRVSSGRIMIEFGSAGDAEEFLTNTRGGMDLRGRRIMIERDGVGSVLAATDQLILRGVPRSANEE